MSVIHLSDTGSRSGIRLCASTDNKSVHAVYAPLDKPEFRSVCCPTCMRVWANDAYEDGDEMPHWIVQIRLSTNIESAVPA